MKVAGGVVGRLIDMLVMDIMSVVADASNGLAATVDQSGSDGSHCNVRELVVVLL